jgi:hypothetical protein
MFNRCEDKQEEKDVPMEERENLGEMRITGTPTRPFSTSTKTPRLGLTLH